MSSINYNDLGTSFVSHFYKLATKVESIDPFFAPDVKASIDGKQVQGKKSVLQELTFYLPFQKSSIMAKDGIQPFKNGSLISSQCTCAKGKAVLTVALTEVKQEKKDDKDVHVYGINELIVYTV